MSTFFRALERAEQDRALRRPVPESEPKGAPAPADVPIAPVPEATPSRTEVSFFRPPAETVAQQPHPARRSDDDARIDEHLVSLLAPTSFEAEQYRALRHLIEQLNRSANLSVIAVSSPDAADGKTTTAINLAGALAQGHNAKVLLIDADLRSPSVATSLGLDDHTTPGLVDAIMNPKLTLNAVTRPYPHLNLSAITVGQRPSTPYEVLKSPRVGELLTEARKTYDYVIVDTPPLVSVPDSRVLGKWVDGFLIVVAAHRTPRKLLEEALSLLEPTKIVGMIFNGDDRHLSRDSYTSGRRRLSRSGTRRRQAASDE